MNIQNLYKIANNYINFINKIGQLSTLEHIKKIIRNIKLTSYSGSFFNWKIRDENKYSKEDWEKLSLWFDFISEELINFQNATELYWEEIRKQKIIGDFLSFQKDKKYKDHIYNLWKKLISKVENANQFIDDIFYIKTSFHNFGSEIIIADNIKNSPYSFAILKWLPEERREKVIILKILHILLLF